MSGLTPPFTSLIGREREIAQIVDLLTSARLVTLTGPGGVGKTRLAQAVVDAVRERFTDGVAFVQLAPVRDPHLVLATIAAALGVHVLGDQPVETGLASALREQHLLLVLDNFEHVQSVAAAIGVLLDACSRLTVLTTSRAPLNLRAERRYPVGPLALPDERQVSQPDVLAGVPAVQLFVERARAIRPDVALSADSMLTIVALCRRLDGLPLAIELAAARTIVLSPAAILTRLAQQSDVLTSRSVDLPARHRTLRSTIAWSYDLLEPSAQTLFRQLAVFAGSWTLESAEAVCVVDGDLLEGLTTLVEASLVRQELSGDEPRFGMLETIHEHAAQLLEQHSETALVRDRHADSFVRLAEVAGPQLRGSTQVAWSRRLSTELGNLQAALGWLREQADAARGLRLLGYLGEFWCDRYGNSEGLAQLRWFLELPAGNPATADRARTLGVAGWQAIFHGDDAASIQFSEQAWALWQQLDDQTYLPFLCVSLGMAYTGVGVEARAARYSEEAVRLGRALSDTRSVARALNNLGVTARDRGEHALATALVDEALTVARGADDEDSMALTLLNLGYQTLTHDDVGRAGDFLRQSLRLYQALGQPWGVVSCVEILALIAQQHGLAAHAVQLFSAAQALHTRLNIADQGAFGAERAAAVHTLRASLGDDAYAVAWSRGQAMTPEEFIAEIHAYAESSREYGAAAVERSAPAHAHGLSPRELDVLRLVVDGRSNQEIATALYISPSTVANHLASIMNKLGLESRTAVATWAVRQGVV